MFNLLNWFTRRQSSDERKEPLLPLFDRVQVQPSRRTLYRPINNFIADETIHVQEGRFQDSLASQPFKRKVCEANEMASGSFATINQTQLDWFASYGFIGWQACALLSQHWLIHNACSIPPEDALRHGWKIKALGPSKIDDQILVAIIEADKTFQLKPILKRYAVKCNIFGFCLALFKVNCDDPDYYQKPFNIDVVTSDSYQGIVIIEPHWVTPQVTVDGYTDPISSEFYHPEFWNVNGKLYHHSHFTIIRGAELPDMLKPTYSFGGISLVQRIYERVYAAERTANEAPILAQSKRLFVYKTDMKEAILHQQELANKAQFQRQYADNYSVQLADLDEEVQKLETNLSDVDNLISNQFNLVAAVCGIPITKLLGTSPKGLNATGEGEMLNYHEKLETIQSEWFDLLLNRHYQLLLKSLDLQDIKIQVIWEPTDSVTAVQQASINQSHAQMLATLIKEGVISPYEGRLFLQDNKKSGFSRFEDTDPVKIPGMNPKNISTLQSTYPEALEPIKSELNMDHSSLE